MTITRKLRKMYDLKITGKTMTINTPSFIIVKNYEIIQDSITTRILNDKICVSLWNKRKIMHITVF